MYGMGVSFLAALLRRELVPGVAFFLSNTRCLWLAIQFGVCSAVGQLFILYTVRHFPHSSSPPSPPRGSSLAFSSPSFSWAIPSTSTRLAFSSPLIEWCGVLLVFFGISYDKIQGGRKKTHGNLSVCLSK